MKKNRILLFITICILFVACKNIEQEKTKKKLYSYYSNGNIKTKYECSDSIKDGIYKKFYQNGKLWEKGYFLKGKENGLFVTYDSLGNKIKEQIFALAYKNDAYNFYTEDTFDIDKKESFINSEIKYNKNGSIDSLNSFFYKTYQNKSTIKLGDTLICIVDLAASMFKSKQSEYIFCYRSLDNKDTTYMTSSNRHYDMLKYVPKLRGHGKVYGMIVEKDSIKERLTTYFFNFKYYVK